VGFSRLKVPKIDSFWTLKIGIFLHFLFSHAQKLGKNGIFWHFFPHRRLKEAIFEQKS
jgi:hypothetical protein